MALSKNGFFSHPIGKLGPVIFYQLNGQLVCRTIGAQKPPTVKQLANQQRMAVTMEALVPLLDFIKIGFAEKAKGTTKSAFNLATSHTKKNALKGEYPNIRIDYNKVLLSSGNLPTVNGISITKTDQGILLNWAPKLQGVYTADDDLVMVALYHPARKTANMYMNAAKRGDCSCFIPKNQVQCLDEPTEIFLCFRSADGERVSNSLYAGNLNGSVEMPQEKEQREKCEALKTHFHKIEGIYKEQYELFLNSGVRSKSYRHLEKEYQMLKRKLENYNWKSTS